MTDQRDITRVEAPRGSFRISAARSAMDLATVLGLTGAVGLIALALALGGSPSAFVNVPSILIVIGGTFAVTMMCFSLSELWDGLRAIGHTLVQRLRDSSEVAVEMIQLSEMARRNGVLTLQDLLPSLTVEPALHKAVGMLVDGVSAEDLEAILRRETQATLAQHSKGAAILRRAAEIAPAMGLIGTLIGLVQMLGNLSDPSTMGPSMAIALLTTFYGAILANVIFSPLASKLDRNAGEEALLNTLYLTGAASIARQENPRRLEMLLNSALPPAKRVRYFD